VIRSEVAIFLADLLLQRLPGHAAERYGLDIDGMDGVGVVEAVAGNAGCIIKGPPQRRAGSGKGGDDSAHRLSWRENSAASAWNSGKPRRHVAVHPKPVLTSPSSHRQAQPVTAAWGHEMRDWPRSSADRLFRGAAFQGAVHRPSIAGIGADRRNADTMGVKRRRRYYTTKSVTAHDTSVSFFVYYRTNVPLCGTTRFSRQLFVRTG